MAEAIAITEDWYLMLLNTPEVHYLNVFIDPSSQNEVVVGNSPKEEVVDICFAKVAVKRKHFKLRWNHQNQEWEILSFMRNNTFVGEVVVDNKKWTKLNDRNTIQLGSRSQHATKDQFVTLLLIQSDASQQLMSPTKEGKREHSKSPEKKIGQETSTETPPRKKRSSGNTGKEVAYKQMGEYKSGIDGMRLKQTMVWDPSPTALHYKPSISCVREPIIRKGDTSLAEQLARAKRDALAKAATKQERDNSKPLVGKVSPKSAKNPNPGEKTKGRAASTTQSEPKKEKHPNVFVPVAEKLNGAQRNSSVDAGAKKERDKSDSQVGKVSPKSAGNLDTGEKTKGRSAPSIKTEPKEKKHPNVFVPVDKKLDGAKRNGSVEAAAKQERDKSEDKSAENPDTGDKTKSCAASSIKPDPKKEKHPKACPVAEKLDGAKRNDSVDAGAKQERDKTDSQVSKVSPKSAGDLDTGEMTKGRAAPSIKTEPKKEKHPKVFVPVIKKLDGAKRNGLVEAAAKQERDKSDFQVGKVSSKSAGYLDTGEKTKGRAVSAIETEPKKEKHNKALVQVADKLEGAKRDGLMEAAAQKVDNKPEPSRQVATVVGKGSMYTGAKPKVILKKPGAV